MVDIRLDSPSNLDGLIAGLQAKANVEREAAEIVQRAGSRYQSRAKFFVPVDTGELKASITIDPGGFLSVAVAAHARHAIFQELGTSVQSGQPFMGPAEASVTPEVVDEFRDLGRRLF